MTPEQTKRFKYWQTRTIIATMVGYALFYFVRKNFSLAMPVLEADLGISKTSLGIFLTLNGVVYGLSRFVNGILADRMNARWYMAIGLALCALANFAFGFGEDVSYWITGQHDGSQFTNTMILFMGIMWVINGMLQGTGFPPCARLLTHWIPPTELATKMSVWNTSHSIGAGLVVILCGYIMGTVGMNMTADPDAVATIAANLGVAPDLTAFSVAGLEASHLQRLNDAKGRYYTWYEAMTGISGCTAEQCPYVQNYEGVDDVGNAFKLDGTEEGEFGVQIRGCCPEGWHVANANDWWDMLMAIKSEYAIPDDFAQGGYTFSGGHDGKPENAITKAGFYKSGCTVKNTGNVGAWLRGGNGRIVDGGIWNQANMTLTDAGEALLQFVDGAESIGFGWYPLGYQKADGSFNSGALGKWGYVWFIGQTNASTARSLVISGTSLNLQTKTNQEAVKDIYLNVRCVKNYTK